jgi:histidinol-phosphatase
MLVAEGAADAAVDHVMAVWDVAALRPIVEEAGGRCTDLAGAVRSDGGSLLSTNGVLHGEILTALACATDA